MNGIVGIIFVVLSAFIIVSIISNYVKNEKAPIVMTKAKLIDKKNEIIHHTNSNGHNSISESFYLIFQLDTESILKFSVKGKLYQEAKIVNEWGQLTFQRKRFLKFESLSNILIK